jgi:tRNA pseudouridine38-40 synthase
MRKVAECFVGTHDFFAFTTGQQGNTWREIQAVEIWREGSLVFIRISANAFLYRMVRRIVATLVRAGQDGVDVGEVEDILRVRSRERVMGTAPAQGLTLIQVTYSDPDYRYNKVFKEEVVV